MATTAPTLASRCPSPPRGALQSLAAVTLLAMVACPSTTPAPLTFADVSVDIAIEDGTVTPSDASGVESADSSDDDGSGPGDVADTSDLGDADATPPLDLPGGDALPDTDTDSLPDTDTDSDSGTDTAPIDDPLSDSFEKGTSLAANGWTASGIVSIVDSFGESTPQDGDAMLSLSTPLPGPGPVPASASKTFEAPTGTNAVTFEMQVLSSEFTEFCGSQFQDRFSMALDIGDKTFEVEFTIDDFCGPDDAACTCTDTAGPCDLNCLSSPFCDYAPVAGSCSSSYPCSCGKFHHGLTPSTAPLEGGSVFSTPWVKSTFYFPAIPHPTPPAAIDAATPVKLTLDLGAEGDTIYQTVVLLDDIVFSTL